MIIDGFQQWAELLIRTLVALPHPRFSQWEWLGKIAFLPGRWQAPQLDHAVVRRSCGRAIGDLGDAAPSPTPAAPMERTTAAVPADEKIVPFRKPNGWRCRAGEGICIEPLKLVCVTVPTYGLAAVP